MDLNWREGQVAEAEAVTPRDGNTSSEEAPSAPSLRGPNATTATTTTTSLAALVPAGLVDVPAEVRGVPVFRVGAEEVVFVAHLLTRVLACGCRAKKHFGLFRCKKFGEYRRQVPTRQWRMDMHTSEQYDAYRQQYGLSRFKEPSAAITLEGLRVW